MSNTFRKKIFKGARIEDMIEHLDVQLTSLGENRDSDYYNGMRDALTQTKTHIIQLFQYEYTKEEK